MLAEGAALGRAAGRAGLAGLRRRRRGRTIYPGPRAPALCCRKSRLLSARPPLPPEPTWLCLWARLVFRGARGSRSSGSCTTTRRWKLEAVLPGRGSRRPSAPRPPPGAAAAAGRAGPSARQDAPGPPAAPGLARCGKEARAASGSLLGGAGKEGYTPPHPQPRAVTLSPAITTALRERGGGGSTERPGAGLGSGTTASWPLSPPRPGSGAEEGHPCEAAWGGGAAPTPPSPRTVVNGSAARPESEGGKGRRRTGRPGGV